MLIIIYGLPATGKTTIAKELSKRIRAEHLDTDIIRKELIKSPKYTYEEKLLVYNIIALLTKYLLKYTNVIVSGTFYKEFLREKFINIAREMNKRYYLIECVASENEIRKRMEHSREYSDADYNVYLMLKKEFEETKYERLRINTENPLHENIKLIMNYIGV